MISTAGLLREYKDLPLSFKLHPKYGDVRPLKDLDAIKSSIRNILLTRRGERPFNPKFGCNMHEYLFDFADDITIMSMKEEITYSLELEPRIRLINIDIKNLSEQNAFQITITCEITNEQVVGTFDLIIKRLR